jgi:N-acetylneuraminic acid mutarotase
MGGFGRRFPRVALVLVVAGGEGSRDLSAAHSTVLSLVAINAIWRSSMKRTKRVFAMATLASLCLVGTAAATATWSPAGNMAIPRVEHRATLLADGRVLVTGGSSPASGNGGYDTKLAELYDPSTNTWSPTGSTTNGRVGHTATRLLDGKVLVTGGINGNICTNDVTTELYDPAAGTWSFSGNLPFATYGHTATLLANGKVLVAGGGNRCGTVYDSAFLYDPATGAWSSTGSMTTGREWHSAALLLDGRVLVAGGEGSFPFPTVSSAEIYNPASGTWTPTGSMASTRCGCSAEFLTRLADGRVMASAGLSGSANNLSPTGPQAEVFDPATGVWSSTGSMSVARAGGTMSLLNDGTVLAAGGSDGVATHWSAELWDPGTGTWSPTGSLASTRTAQTASLLANGKLLVVGGIDGTNSYLSSAELYTSFVFAFTGFFPPVGNPPSLNAANAGSGIPVKFSLSGNQGLNIFETGYPKSQPIDCTTKADLAPATSTAGSLSYDSATDRYTYNWKTEKGWGMTCRKLIVKLSDSSSHIAYFRFTK